MKDKGASSIELLMWILGAVGAVTAYAHMTFITYREVAPRLDRIENKIDSVLEKSLSK
jgi:hypothetical protein